MKTTVTHRLDDTYIEKAWKHAEMEEIEDLAAGLLGKAQEAQSIEDDLFCVLYLAFRCGFKTAIGNIRTYCIANLSWLSPLRRYCGSRIYWARESALIPGRPTRTCHL